MSYGGRWDGARSGERGQGRKAGGICSVTLLRAFASWHRLCIFLHRCFLHRCSCALLSAPPHPCAPFRVLAFLHSHVASPLSAFLHFFFFLFEHLCTLAAPFVLGASLHLCFFQTDFAIFYLLAFFFYPFALFNWFCRFASLRSLLLCTRAFELLPFPLPFSHCFLPYFLCFHFLH